MGLGIERCVLFIWGTCPGHTRRWLEPAGSCMARMYWPQQWRLLKGACQCVKRPTPLMFHFQLKLCATESSQVHASIGPCNAQTLSVGDYVVVKFKNTTKARVFCFVWQNTEANGAWKNPLEHKVLYYGWENKADIFPWTWCSRCNGNSKSVIL